MQSEFTARKSNCCQLSVKPVPGGRHVLVYMGILVLLGRDFLVNTIGVLLRHKLVLEIVEMVD